MTMDIRLSIPFDAQRIGVRSDGVLRPGTDYNIIMAGKPGMKMSGRLSAEEDEYVVSKLIANGYDYERTAAETGVSIKTLRRASRRVPQKGLEERLQLAINHMLSIMPTSMSGRDWGITMGILVDKLLLLRGKATSRVEQTSTIRGLDNVSDRERDAILAEADRIIAEAASGLTAEADAGPLSEDED